MHDLKYAFRMLVKSPGFSLVAILSLALGIGANTAIFSLINAVLLRPLPVADASSLVTVSTTDQRNPGNLQLSHLNFKDLRTTNAVFTEMAAFTFAAVNYSTDRESEVIPAQVVTANYFSVLGTQPMLGRAFRPEEEANAVPVAVVSEGFWERSLGSDPGAVGRTITLNRVPYTIIGVAPKHFSGTLLGGGPAVGLPMQRPLVPVPEWYETRRGLFLFSVARLKPGVTVDQARANLKAIFAQLESAFPTDNKGRSAAVVPLLHGMILVAAGLTIGLAIALGMAGLLKALVVGVNPRDPITFIVTPAVLGFVALVASYVPARRATRIDPLIALRTD
jgi:putative ABC transport system permease protein